MTVFQKNIALPDFDRKEICRYAGVKKLTDDIRPTLENCIDMCRELTGRVCYCETPISVGDGRVDFGFAKVQSEGLCKNLDGCEGAIIFAATVGVEIDRLISKYSSLSPSRAVILQAIGAERIEALCDCFCEMQKSEKQKLGKTVRPRFSPGYGDLSLEFQRDIFLNLDCFRKIGLSLSDRLLMSPSKSVTAIVGICSCSCGSEKQPGCAACDNEHCQFRR